MSLVALHCVKLEEIIHIIIIIMTSSTSGPSPTPVSSKKKQRGCCMYRPPPNSFLLSQEDEDGLSHKVVLLLLLLLLFKFEPAWQQYHSLVLPPPCHSVRLASTPVTHQHYCHCTESKRCVVVGDWHLHWNSNQTNTLLYVYQIQYVQ